MVVLGRDVIDVPIFFLNLFANFGGVADAANNLLVKLPLFACENSFLAAISQDPSERFPIADP